jgi:hypothetical protein
MQAAGELYTDEYFQVEKDGREAKQQLGDAVETLTAFNDAHNQYEKDLKSQLQRVNNEDEREVMGVDLELLQEERGQTSSH